MIRRQFRSDRVPDEAGFTILELMVCLSIIAALLTIVVPSIINYEGKTQDRAAQSDLRYALDAEKVFFVDGQQYTQSVPELLQVEPGLSYSTTVPPVTSGVVGVSVTSTASASDTVIVSTKSASGTCWYVKDVGVGPSAQTTFGKDACLGNPTFTGSW